MKDIRDVLQKPNQFVWIGVYEPSTETLAKFQQELGLHELAIEDAHRAHQRPKRKNTATRFLLCSAPPK